MTLDPTCLRVDEYGHFISASIIYHETSGIYPTSGLPNIYFRDQRIHQGGLDTIKEYSQRLQLGKYRTWAGLTMFEA